MARSDVSSALLALKSAFAGIDGTGTWHADFSGAGAVVIGKGLPADGPDTMLVIGDWSIDHQYVGLQESEFAMTVSIMARVPASSDDEETRILDALDVADDLTRIIITNQALRLNGFSPKPAFAPYEDDAFDDVGPLLIVGTITYHVILDFTEGL